MVIEGQMDLVMDAPGLYLRSGGIEMTSDLHGIKVSVRVKGSVSFNAEGHMVTTLKNTEAVKIPVSVTLGERLAGIFLEVPVSGLQMKMITRR